MTPKRTAGRRRSRSVCAVMAMKLKEAIVRGPLGPIVIIGLVGLIFSYFLYWGKDARHARYLLRNITTEQIQEIIIAPVPHDSDSLCSSAISIKDKERIEQITSLVHSAGKYHPNHPEERWAVILRFRHNDEVFGGRVASTSNRGVLFYYEWDEPSGWIYTTLRQDQLGPVIENAVATHGK